MGYSKSKVTLLKLLSQLEPLRKGEPCSWHVKGGQASKFAYKVREALHVAKLHKEEFPELADAAEKYRITVNGPNKVRAVPVEPMGPTIEVDDVNGGKPPAPGQAREIKGPQTDLTIIEVWFDNETGQPLHFPDAELDETDLRRLYRWAEARELIFFVSDEGLTLQRSTDELKEFAWAPGGDHV